MGKKILPLPSSLNAHVIVDVRDGTEYIRTEHSLLEAMVAHCQEVDKKFAFSDEMKVRLMADLHAIKFKELGITAHRLVVGGGDLDDTDFFSDYEYEDRMVTRVGPFYTLDGCKHTKNAVFFARYLNDWLGKIDREERELSEYEVEIGTACRHFISLVTDPNHTCMPAKPGEG